jgi:hypothetical protein
VLLTYRLEIRGRLPSVAREELRRRFGEVEVRSGRARTVVSGLTVDQAALRAVLGLLWDVGCEIQLVRALSPSGQE